MAGPRGVEAYPLCRIALNNSLYNQLVVSCLATTQLAFRQGLTACSCPLPRPPQVKSGNDDLRQDAVMQQFFGLVNAFLSDNPRTQRRALAMRTYKAGS
jgi:hypothetical protein